MIDLRQLTLVVVATRGHALTKIAIEDCLRQAEFGAVLIYTDDPARVGIPNAQYFEVPDWDNKKAAGQFYYAKAAENVRTPAGLYLEWDAGIFNPGKWKPEFMQYDYIGAPWNTSDDMKVGNGGFTIMSQRLGNFLVTNFKNYPCYTDWDVCRTWRKKIEHATGFKWAPYELAREFAWELAPRSPNTFGYHGIFRWPEMIGHEETARRVVLMTEDPYLITKLPPLFKEAGDWLVEAIGPEAYQRYVNSNPPPAHRRGGPFTSQLPIPRRPTTPTVAQRRALILAQLNRPGLKA